MKHKTYLLVVFFLAFLSFSAFAQSTDTSFQQAVTDYQHSPNKDTAEKVIKLSVAMNKSPQISEEARQHFVMAQTYQKKAKNEVGYKLAVEEYKQVLLLAPWLPEAYNNLGILYELLGNFDEAILNLKLYLLTNPSDARNARDKMVEIEATEKLASAEAATKNVQEEEAKAKTVEGEWYYTLNGQILTGSHPLKIYKQNGEWALDEGLPQDRFYNSHIIITNTSISYDRDTYESPEMNHQHRDLRLSDDGSKLTGTYTLVDTSVNPPSHSEHVEYFRKLD